MDKTLWIISGVLVAAALIFLAGYKAGADSERSDCQADKIAAVEQAIEQHNRLEAENRALMEEYYADALEQAKQESIVEVEVIKYVENTVNRECLDADGLRLWNQ